MYSDDSNITPIDHLTETDDIARFTDHFSSFSRVINSLQRKYIELRDEFESQNGQLADANRRLIAYAKDNLTANEFLNGLLTAAKVGVVAVDRAGQVTHFNPAAARILNIAEADVIGKQYSDVIPSGESIEATVLHTIQTGEELQSVERRAERDDGATVCLSVSTSIISDDYGRRAGAVEVLHDLTTIKKMESEIARLNTLAALGEMAATVAHEVRNPLAGIAGFASLLERDLSEDDRLKPLARKIMRGVDSLNDTVTSLLNYTRFEEITRTQHRWDEFLSAAIDQYLVDNEALHDRLSISINQPPDPIESQVRLLFDRMLFRQVLFNIFANAVESAGGEAEIDVSYRILARDEANAVYGKKILLSLDETVVETTISDNGPGIDDDKLDRIFAPFFYTKSEGNGLGLAVVWKIIKGHGGDIIAENGETGGARFKIALPVKMIDQPRERR
jgi:PAS domain S-box-containing protein